MAEKFKKNSSLTEIHGYVPLAKRIAVIQTAGMRTMLAKDELYDNINEVVVDRKGKVVGEKMKVAPAPLLPRHLDADYADVAQFYTEYAQRRREILAAKRQAREAAKPGGTGGSPPVSPAETPPEPEKPA